MSILTVEHLTHGFGDRAIFQDVSFRLLKGEHIGLVGANGEGKSTFMNIITGKLQPDEGKIEWSKNVHVGYLDQHAVLTTGMTIGSVLRSAFDPLFQMEVRMNEICDKMCDADENQMMELMEELGTIQDLLTAHDFYLIDSKVEEVARALGLLDLGLDRDVTDLSGGQCRGALGGDAGGNSLTVDDRMDIHHTAGIGDLLAVGTGTVVIVQTAVDIYIFHYILDSIIIRIINGNVFVYENLYVPLTLEYLVPD